MWESIRRLGVELGLTPPAARDLIRAYAYGSDRSVDDVAADLLAGRLPTADLQDPAAG